MKKVIGIYSETCNRTGPVIGRADTLFDLLDESRAYHGDDAIDYTESYTAMGTITSDGITTYQFASGAGVTFRSIKFKLTLPEHRA